MISWPLDLVSQLPMTKEIFVNIDTSGICLVNFVDNLLTVILNLIILRLKVWKNLLG